MPSSWASGTRAVTLVLGKPKLSPLIHGLQSRRQREITSRGTYPWPAYSPHSKIEKDDGSSFYKVVLTPKSKKFKLNDLKEMKLTSFFFSPSPTLFS